MTWNKVLSKFFSLLLIILPLIVWGGYYEGPKVFLFLIIGFVLILFWIYRTLIQKKFFELSKVDFFYLFWLLTLLISSLFGIHPLESILGGSYRHQGVIFFLTLWLVYKTVQIFNKDEKRFLYKGIGFAVLAESVFVLFQFASGRLYFGKPLGTLGETNAVAGFLAIGSYFLFQNSSNLLYAFPVIAILITESRAGILALLPNLWFIVDSLNRKIRNILIGIVLFVSAFSLFYISIVKTDLPFDTVESRQIIWPIAIQQISKRPVLGYGAESIDTVFQNNYLARGFSLSGLIIDRAHNIFLDVSMWSGITGLILFTGFLVTFFKSLGDKYKKLAFLSFIVYAFFQPLSIVHWLFFILL